MDSAVVNDITTSLVVAVVLVVSDGRVEVDEGSSVLLVPSSVEV